ERPRLLDVDDVIERRHRAEEAEDRLLLVQVQLGKPPERVAAAGEPAPEGFAVDGQLAEAFDPGMGVAMRLLVARRVEIPVEADLAHAAGGFDREQVGHADAPAVRISRRPRDSSAATAAR